MLTNSTRTVLYTGVTSNLKYRVWQHKNDIYIDSYTSKYRVKILVYYEEWPSIQDAINREKEIKKWRREKKNWLVEKENKNWEELHLD